MAELEDDLAALAPAVDVRNGLAALHATRRRRRRSRLAMSGTLSLLAVVAVGAIWSTRIVDDEIRPAQVGGPDEPATTVPPTTSPVPECELEVAGHVGFQGPQGIALTATNEVPCEVRTVSAAGSLGGRRTAIPLAPWEDRADANVNLPTVIAPASGFAVIVHNRPFPCPDSDAGYVDIELRLGAQLFDLPLEQSGPWPYCGIAIAVVDTDALDSDGPPPPWELLAQADAVVDNGSLAAATSSDELAELWETHGLDAPLPDVDFADAVVVAATIGNRGCPPPLTGFEQTTGGVFTPQFSSLPAECFPLDIPMTHVAILARHFVGDAFVLRLPPQDPYYGEQRLAVVLPGGPPLCELELSLAISGTELLFPNAFEEEPSNDAFAVSFVNVSAEPCLIVDATARGETGAEDVLALPSFLLDPAAGLELPATIDPGRGFRAVFTHNIPPGLCDAPPGSELRSLELAIGDRVVDISPGLTPFLVFPCGGFFRLEPTVAPEGIPGDPLDQRFRVCLLSFPAQCDDPFIRIA